MWHAGVGRAAGEDASASYSEEALSKRLASANVAGGRGREGHVDVVATLV